MTTVAAGSMKERTIDRGWIAEQFAKGIDAEHALAGEARQRAQSPPDADLAVLYNEIAAADERHRAIVETIATRYGHTPRPATASGIVDAIKGLTGKVTEIGTTPQERLGHDLALKANAVHWYTAWIAAFEAIGESESARELAAVLTEEKTHLDALQLGLNRIVERGALGGGAAVETAAK